MHQSIYVKDASVKHTHEANPSDGPVRVEDHGGIRATSANLQKWNDFNLTSLNSLKVESKKIKKLIRYYGVPDSLRGQVWLNMAMSSQGNVAKKTIDESYKNLIEQTFNTRQPPESVTYPPLFGSISLKFEYHPSLTEEIKSTVCILLTCLMQYFHEIHAPQIPDILCILMQYQTKEEAAFTSLNVLKTPQKYFSTPNTLSFFSYLIKRFLPRLYTYMTKTLKIHTYEFAGTWINHLFVDVVPYYVVIRLFDAYLHQGIQMLFRFGLAILYKFQDQLLKCLKKDDFLQTIKSQIRLTKLPCEIFKLAWKFKIKASILNWSAIKALKRCEFSAVSQISKSPELYYQPKLNFSSRIINDDYWRSIYSWIPNRHRIRDPVLLFGDGGKPMLSLKKMYKVIEDWAPTVLLIKSDQGRVFGLFMSCLWRMTKQNEHIGTGECFLFQLIPTKEKYGWEPAFNNIFLTAQEDLFSMGAGQDGFGLCINANGIGSSETCETFQNKPLNGDHSKLFRCAELEVFGFE